MKKLTATLALVLLAIVAFPQAKNLLMPSDLIMNYSVPVLPDIKNSPYVSIGTELTPKTYLYYDVKPGASTFGKYVLEGIQNKVPLYADPQGVPGFDPLGKPMNKKEVDKALGIRTDTVSMLNDKDVMETKIIRGEGAQENEITFCRFTEKWDFDPIKYSLKKTVLQYTPARDVYFHNDASAEKVFKGRAFTGSFLSKNNASATTKLLNIRYEFALGNDDLLALKILKQGNDENDTYGITEKKDCPYWNSHNRQKFLDALVDPVLNGKVKVTDYYTNAMLDLKTVRQRLGETSDTITMVNPLDPDRDTTFVITREPGIYDVLSLIFVEEWFINPQTLDIRKQVVAIAPVCWYYTTDPGTGEIGFPKKLIAFLIKLN